MKTQANASERSTNQPAGEVLKPEEQHLLNNVASIICAESCGLVSDCRSREAARALFDQGWLHPLPKDQPDMKPEDWRAEKCDDETWMVCTEGDVIASGLTETVARRIANSLPAEAEAQAVAWLAEYNPPGVTTFHETFVRHRPHPDNPAFRSARPLFTRPAPDTGWQIPKGWRLVPEELTDEMIAAQPDNADTHPPTYRKALWRAQLAALSPLPAPPTQEDGR